MNPYKLADATAKTLGKLFVRKASETKKSILKMDELNVLRQIDVLYEYMDTETRRKLKKLYGDRFFEMLVYLGYFDRPEHNEELGEPEHVEKLSEERTEKLLDEPNEVTHYTYETEVYRKRDRAKEAVLSVPTKTQKQMEIDKSVRIFMQMVTWYVDFTSQDAEIEALKDSGVKTVVRHEMNDGKVCKECHEADGETYPINEIPTLPHPRCRRWFTPHRRWWCTRERGTYTTRW